jgi:RNA methyltransferase, TrmH family
MELLSKLKKSFFTGLGQKKFRQLNCAFPAEGIRTIEEFQRQGLEPMWIAGTEKWRAFLESRVSSGIPCYLLSDKLAESCSFLQSPPGIIAVFPMKEPLSATEVKTKEAESIVVVNGIKDAGNLGTLIRTMHWFGWKSLWLSPDTTDPYNPKAIQAAMGSTAALTLISGTAEELSDCLKEWQLNAYVLSLNGKEQLPGTLPMCVILGSESHGVDKEWENIGQAVKLPGISENPPDSLNVTISFASLAGAIAYKSKFD